MPNGGSDCCGTCWFNRANGGRAGSVNHDRSIPSHCEIRDLAIGNPFYTYCANHPARLDRRVPVPLGPVSVYTGTGRAVWKHAPDTEEVRLQLLRLLEDPRRLTDGYPFYGNDLVSVVVGELERLGEPRAIDVLEGIAHAVRRNAEAVEDIQFAIRRMRKAVEAVSEGREGEA